VLQVETQITSSSHYPSEVQSSDTTTNVIAAAAIATTATSTITSTTVSTSSIASSSSMMSSSVQPIRNAPRGKDIDKQPSYIKDAALCKKARVKNVCSSKKITMMVGQWQFR